MGLAEHRLGLGTISLLNVNLGQQQIAIREAGPMPQEMLQGRRRALEVLPFFLVEGQGKGVFRLLGVQLHWLSGTRPGPPAAGLWR